MIDGMQGKLRVQIVLPQDGVFHHEDLRPGMRVIYGQRSVSRDEIIAFATAYDPQPIHLDE